MLDSRVISIDSSSYSLGEAESRAYNVAGMVWKLLHYLIVGTYVLAPVAAVVIDVLVARRRSRKAPGPWLVGVVIAGVIIGTTLAVLYALAVDGRIRIDQAMLASYFAVSLLLILRGFDWLVQRGANGLMRVSRVPEKPTFGVGVRMMLSGIIRLAVLFAIGLPFVMATILTYRPKVDLREDPRQQLGFNYEPVEFHATDGTKLSGWWIPAETPKRSADRKVPVGERTVIICHGLASNKANQLVLARGFVPYGYNVLIFDFRAHGASGGQLTSFGDLERHDVLGAVRWLREQRQKQSVRIYGAGASMGAAALIAAASSDSPEGKSIDALAVYGTYDSVRRELDSVADSRFVPPLAFLVRKLGLPIGSAQVGTDLAGFAPAELITELWPRPILVVHGVADEIIDFDRGQRLFESALQPKARLWVERAGHNEIINDEDVAERVRAFFQTAEPVPVI